MKSISAARKLAAILAFAAGLSAAPLTAQTNLTMFDPGAVSKLVNNKTEIERCILLATPGSLASAKDGLAQSKVISDEDKSALLEIIRGISSILYPPPMLAVAGKAPAAAPRVNGQPPAFFVDPSLKNIAPAYSLCLAQLVEASQGRIFDAPKGSEQCLMAQILPALAIFGTQDRNVAATALAFSGRYRTLGDYPSAIPALVDARYAEFEGDPLKSFYLNQDILAKFPDVWIASFKLGTLSLALNMPVRALGYLTPLMTTRKDDLIVMKPYAIALYRNGKLADAEPFVAKSLAGDPESAELMAMEAHILIDKNGFAAAQPILDALGRKKPSDRMYLYLKTLMAKGLNRNDEAQKWARKALQNYPDDPQLMVLLAGILFKNADADHREAAALCAEARKRFASEKTPPPPALSPLESAMRDEAESEATRFLLLDAYSHQDWAAAASMLDSASTAGIDKVVVATILRKSGHEKEALAFASEWYKSDPKSEAAAEAYLRSMASERLASVSSGVSDAGAGILGLSAGAKGGAGQASADSSGLSLVGLVIQLLSGGCSANLRSYLYYLRGTLLTDNDAAIDSYRMALLERADNVEAIAALAKAYALKRDPQKALFFIKQAKAIGIDDADLASDLQTLEKSLTQG